MKNYSSLLVANRGEIASRIFRTANKMGLRTIAIYTEADRHSPYINDADTAIMIETSYLDMEAILTALDLSSAEAIHPGYGFLSENHIFAEKIQSKGIIWVGPDADAIRIMGDKIEAKKYAKILGYNYNSSEWFEQSYKILNKDYVKKKKLIAKDNKPEDKKGFFKKIIKMIK